MRTNHDLDELRRRYAKLEFRGAHNSKKARYIRKSMSRARRGMHRYLAA